MKNNIEDCLNHNKVLNYWKNQSPYDKNIEKFTDLLFPPNINSILGKNENGEYIDKINGEKKANKLKKLSIKWKRPEEIFNNEKYFLFKDKSNLNISNIKQGNIADCYFISSIIGLAKDPNMIYKLFNIKEINIKGYYEIILFIDGDFQLVIIDDYLPVLDNNKFCFCNPINNEIWLCLLEKAWAKINGGYANIIKGFAHHVLETLTGFPSLNLMHSSYGCDYIWNNILNSFKNNYIITVTSKNDLKEIGLESNHSYALIDCYELKNIKKDTRVIKLRDPNGKKIISAQNNKNSILFRRNMIDLNKDAEDGILYLYFEDFFNCFSFTNICYVIPNNYSKKIKIEKSDIYKGNIFNIYLKEDCILSINLIKKNWIFNKNMNKPILPSFICMVKYDPIKNINDNKIFFDYISNIESEENVSINSNLKIGYYLIYSYVDYTHSILNNDFYYLKFDSNINFQIVRKPCDIKENGFPILKNIKMQEYLNSNKFINNSEGINYLIKYKNKDLSMKIIYNPNNSKWLKITEDCSEIKNMFILSPYYMKNKIFEWYIPPKKYDILLGIIIDSSKEGSLNLKSKNYLIKYIPMDYKDYEVNISQYANNIFN